jgi:hypothetical protein
MSSDAQTSADLKAVFEAVARNQPVDPEVAKRVREKSDALRRETKDEISIDLLRSIREE